MGVLKFIFICIEVVLLFNILIIVHEIGHFLAARWRGLTVETFAIWFGKPIWKKTIGGINYQLGSIPAGGFVAIPQMGGMEAIEGESQNDNLPEAKPLDKIIVAAAGPLFSLGLAFVMAAGVWLAGKPVSEFDSPRIGFVAPGSPAEKAGIQVGDTVLAVDGQSVSSFSGMKGIQWRVIRSEGETIPFIVRRGGEEIPLVSNWEKPETSSLRRPALRRVGIGPFMPAGIQFVTKGSPADQAGLQSGDLITSIADTPISQIPDLGPALETNLGKTVSIEFLRQNKDQETSLTCQLTIPENIRDGAALGIAWGRMKFDYPSPWAQVRDAATAIYRMLGALFSPQSDVKASHFSGPVGIMNLYYRVFESDYGWQLALSLSVLINVNLALLNFLPFPVLDGGHIVLSLYEMIFRRRINIRFLNFLQNACMILLIGFMLYVTFYDVGDLVTPDKKPDPSPTPAAVK